MNRIAMIGQAITVTNYATDRIFNFSPELVRAAAEVFLASGIPEIEIPQGVLDPDSRFPETGIDEKTLTTTLAGLPGETRLLGTYLSSLTLGEPPFDEVFRIIREKARPLPGARPHIA